jgi:catechol 2,3-dioxygenase-like lactoylglutathione lyase family enzyme
MLGDANVHATIAVKDRETATKFYEGTLGLKKVDENPGGVLYHSGSAKIFVYESETAGSGKATCASWEVDSPESVVEALKAKGVMFEHYDDIPGVTREGDIHVMGPAKAAWFKDPFGNILCVGSAM